MTDPLSVTVSIASIAAMGVRAIVFAEGFISDCRYAPSEVLKLTTEMQAMGTVLGRLAEFSQSPGLDALLPQQLVADLRPILASCMLLFERTERIVGKLNKGMWAGSVLARLRWIIKEKELEKLRIGISEHKLTLNMTLAVASCLATHQVHASTTRIEAHNEVILDKVNQLLSQVPEQLQNVSGNSTASSLIIRRFIDDLTSYAGSVCNHSWSSSVIMPRHMNDVPCTESTVATPQPSFDQQNKSRNLNAGILESPMGFSSSYMLDEVGDIESWKRIGEMNTNIEIGPVSDPSLLRGRSQRGLDNTIPRAKKFPRRKPVSPLSPALSISGTSVHSPGRRNLAYDAPGTQFRAPSKLVDPTLPPTPDSGVYSADNTPVLTNRTSFDEEREVLERLLLTDPQRMHWLRVMLDKSNENILPNGTKAVESVVHGVAGGSTDRILRVHELKVPIIKVPVPFRGQATDESVAAHLARRNVPIIEAPTPSCHGAGAASSGGDSQRVSSRLTVPVRMQSPSLENLTLSPQQEVKIVRLSPTESWCLPQGWEFGGSFSPSRNPGSDH